MIVLSLRQCQEADEADDLMMRSPFDLFSLINVLLFFMPSIGSTAG